MRYPGITERGLSIVEVMIAAALLLIIALGILPLFSRSIISNRQGLDSTEVSNMARTQMEEYVQLPFNHQMLTVPDGSEVLVVEQHYSEKDDKWKDGKDPAGWGHRAFRPHHEDSPVRHRPDGALGSDGSDPGW